MLRLRTAVATTLCGLLLAAPSFAKQPDYFKKAADIVMKDGKNGVLVYKPRSDDERIRKRIPSWDYDLRVDGKTLKVSLRRPGKKPSAYFRDSGLNGINNGDFAWFQKGDDVVMYNKQNSKRINQFYLLVMAKFVGGYYPFLNKKK